MLLSRLAVFIIAPTLIQAPLALAANAQADVNQRASAIARPGVVRVVAGCSGKYAYYDDEYALVVGEIGSGYFVDPSGYVVTNAHVLQPGEQAGCQESLFRRFVALVTGEKDFNKISEQEKNDIRQHSQITGKIDYVNRVVLSNGDSLTFETKQVGKPVAGDRDDIAVIKVKVSNAPTVRLKNVGTVEAQKAVITLGYPLNQNFAALSEPPPLKKLPIGEPLGQAIVFGGRVAAGGQNPNGDNPVLFFDTSIPMGLSGSPVVNSQGEIIGMTSVVGANSGQQGNAASLIASGTVLKRLQQAGGNNQEGMTDRLYREGLDLFEKRNFAAAKTKFQNVKERFPYHSDVDALMGDSDQGMAQAQRKQSKVLLFGVGASVVALFALYLLLRSNQVRTIMQYWLGRSPALDVPQRPEAQVIPEVPIAVVQESPIDLPRAAVTQISGRVLNSLTVTSTQQFIELKNQDGQVRRFYLRQERHHLGRDRDWADLQTPDSGWEVLSRHHAVLEKEGADYRIYDGDRHNASTNGIFLNGVPITLQEGHLLQDGDRLETGDDPHNQVIWTYSNPGERQAANP